MPMPLAAAPPLPHSPALTARNRRVGWGVFGVILFMLVAAYAAVPLYDLFCRTTGFGGRPMVATSAPTTLDSRLFSVRFDANVAQGLPVRFFPEAESVLVRAGEVKTAFYRVENTASHPVTLIASFNVSPDQTGGFFNKITCFCFNEITLHPGEQRLEEVVFFIDPAISREAELASIHTITLSYTFFQAKTANKPLAEAQPRPVLP